jgi:hypothetical protein
VAMFRYPDPTPIMPQLQGFSIKKKATMNGTVFPSVSGRETRILTQAFPLWEFELTYEALRTRTENIDPYTQYNALTQYEKIAAVFLACKGRYGRFFFADPGDNSRTGQFIGTGNGSRTRFRVVRSISTGPLTFVEPVGGVNITSHIPVVKLNGVVQSGGSWFIDSNDLQTLTFFSPPSAGVTILMDFYYYYYCQFLDDLQNFEEFMYNLHRIASLKFRSTKDCATDSVDPYMFL